MLPKAPPSRRILREQKTAAVMIELYCAESDHAKPAPCPGCRQLLDYALSRLGSCPFAKKKPTCLKCKVHCYSPEMRAKIREVMRFSGPRLIWRRPLLALLHVLDGIR